MTQSIFGLGMGGTGIVTVLIIAGILLCATNVNAAAGQLAIWGGIGIGLIFGGLGVIGIVSRYV
ncbi:hypothetical protein L1S32_03715 [Methanogenium sp. S4BF]|uniref:hypothetical protein n=1 Tax=Methanogenium sp. S4BF TaxID=1789226 RepID=UPI00241763A7|nr:hypothetical protein [Methanogenium sp. S4BF]WFN35239.1 hypothetical protein L1S32_03715 [Methanogenium sp. S4BF]